MTQGDLAELDPPPTAIAAANREFKLVFAGLILAMALAALDQNIVSTALPRIVGELGGLSQLSWTVTAFMLTSTASTPLYGKLSDMYGRKSLFLISIGVFLFGSALCGAAQSMTELVLFRGVQGVGAGGLMTLSQTTIGDLLPPRERARYQGLFTATFAVCGVVGPLIGGILTSALSWRWVFYVNLPVGGLALLLISIGLNRPHAKVPHRIDFLGALLLVAATTTVLLLLNWGGAVYPWDSVTIIALFVIAILLAVALLAQETVAAEPVLPLRLFLRRSFAATVALSGIVMLSLFGSSVFLPLYFQLVVGADPVTAGLMMVPQVGGLIVASTIGGNLLSRTGRPKIVLVSGMGVTLIALLGMAVLIRINTGLVPEEACLFALGIGAGLTMPTLSIMTQNAVAHADLGVATSSMSFFRSLGGSLGVALAGGIMTARLDALLPKDTGLVAGRSLLDAGVQQLANLPVTLHDAVTSAYRHAISMTFIASAVIAAIGFGLALTIRENRLR